MPKTTASRSVISPAAKEARPHCWSAQTSAIHPGSRSPSRHVLALRVLGR
ncbi:hypothetical protein ACFRDV_39000 [Streptomyces fagopyri]